VSTEIDIEGEVHRLPSSTKWPSILGAPVIRHRRLDLFRRLESDEIYSYNSVTMPKSQGPVLIYI